jgi:hypothetical protein
MEKERVGQLGRKLRLMKGEVKKIQGNTYKMTDQQEHLHQHTTR